MAKMLTCYYRPKPGGLCKRLFRCIRSLLAQGHTVHYLAAVEFPISDPNCHFHRFPWPESKTETFLFWLIFHLTAPLMLFVIGYRFKIGKLFAFGYTYSLVMQPLRMTKRIPLSLFLRADTIQNHQFKQVPQWLIGLERIIEGAGLHGCRLYGVSKTLTKNVPSRHTFFKPLLSETLTNEIKKLPKPNLEKFSFPKPLRLGCVGILEKRKNQEFLLDVMTRVRKENAFLTLFGIGPDECELQKRVESAGLEDRVVFKGWVNSDEIWINIDLMLMPSLHEGCPNALLEAMENNTPVLANRIPEHEEILHESQLIPIDVDSWVCHLEKIIADPFHEFNKMVQNQAMNCRNFYFDWDREICKRILK